jgi:hypothetical protein
MLALRGPWISVAPTVIAMVIGRRFQRLRGPLVDGAPNATKDRYTGAAPANRVASPRWASARGCVSSSRDHVPRRRHRNTLLLVSTKPPGVRTRKATQQWMRGQKIWWSNHDAEHQLARDQILLFGPRFGWFCQDIAR